MNRFLGLVFAQRHKDGRTDLEAVESALRAALHQAGAAALTELLKFEARRPSSASCRVRVAITLNTRNSAANPF